MEETNKKGFASFNLPKELVDDLKLWKTAFESSYGKRVSYEDMMKKMLESLSLVEPVVADAHTGLLNPDKTEDIDVPEHENRKEYKYSDKRYYDSFEEGEYVTLTRKDGLISSSKPWIIGIVAKTWYPGNDDEVYLLADYTFREGYQFADSIEIYEKPDLVVPYYQGWRHSTPDEIKIFDDALAHTGHKYNINSGRIEEITPKSRASMKYNLTFKGVFPVVTVKDDFEPLYSEDID